MSPPFCRWVNDESIAKRIDRANLQEARALVDGARVAGYVIDAEQPVARVYTAAAVRHRARAHLGDHCRLALGGRATRRHQIDAQVRRALGQLHGEDARRGQHCLCKREIPILGAY